MLYASCTAILVKNLPEWLTSPPPVEKKKLVSVAIHVILLIRLAQLQRHKYTPVI
jgi:hypothetical protein